MIQVKIPGFQNDLSALPSGETAAQIIVTGGDLDGIVRILRGAASDHQAPVSGDLQLVARELLAGLDQIRREREIRVGREAIRAWLASGDSYNLHVLTEALEVIGIGVSE